MKYTYELCKGRHPTPASSAIFAGEVNPTDVEGLRAAANAAIPADCDGIDLYVTGLSVALLAVVAVCEARQISLTAWHFDRESGEYYPQAVLQFVRCGFCGERYSAYSGYCGHCGAN